MTRSSLRWSWSWTATVVTHALAALFLARQAPPRIPTAEQTILRIEVSTREAARPSPEPQEVNPQRTPPERPARAPAPRGSAEGPHRPAPAVAQAQPPASAREGLAPARSEEPAQTALASAASPVPPPATGTNAQATVAAAGEGDAITPAEPLAASQRRPEYPPAARREGLEGTTELRVRVGAGGRVEHVAVARSSGHAELDAAATVAVARWRFVPARYRGQPVADQVLVTITFDLDDESWESD